MIQLPTNLSLRYRFASEDSWGYQYKELLAMTEIEILRRIQLRSDVTIAMARVIIALDAFLQSYPDGYSSEKWTDMIEARAALNSVLKEGEP